MPRFTGSRACTSAIPRPRRKPPKPSRSSRRHSAPVSLVTPWKPLRTHNLRTHEASASLINSVGGARDVRNLPGHGKARGVGEQGFPRQQQDEAALQAEPPLAAFLDRERRPMGPPARVDGRDADDRQEGYPSRRRRNAARGEEGE